MEKIKVSDLKDEKLAEWVARALGFVKEYYNDEWWWKSGNREIVCSYYRPDINGWQAMELVKKFKLCVDNTDDIAEAKEQHWTDCGYKWFYGYGETPEIAICRAVVASVYGEHVEDSN